jgi:hypothetical protein
VDAASVAAAVEVLPMALLDVLLPGLAQLASAHAASAASPSRERNEEIGVMVTAVIAVSVMGSDNALRTSSSYTLDWMPAAPLKRDSGAPEKR